MFGAPPGDSWQEDWQKEAEGPLTPVTIAHPFAVSRYAISFDEWDACVEDGGCAGFKPDDNGWGRSNRPVINVSWENASAYVAWLSKKTGKSYRLLSEAEREYVTRAGTTTAFWFGASLSPKQAHYLQGANENVNSIFRERPAPVNAFEANPWGLYNVHGNVWDWTADCWNANHAGHPGDGSPRTTGDCSHRVLKGGSWLNLPKFVRAAARNRVSGHFRYKTISFRVARTAAVH
jgi:formylglycine-generating enzyme required for sulfatase activity